MLGGKASTKGGQAMTCPRCSGLLVIEGSGMDEMERCLNCGHRHYFMTIREEQPIFDFLEAAQARRAVC
jgi:hypothetical protein